MKTKNDSFFKQYFLKYCWASIFILLAVIIFDLQFPNQNVYLRIISDFFRTVGVTLLVASIFSWATDTENFMNEIQSKLIDIVINRKFLTSLDHDSKINTLGAILKPINDKSKIGDYCQYYIEKTLGISKENVRTNYKVDARIYFDKLRNRVACEKYVTYTLYPTESGYSPIRIGYSDKETIGNIYYLKLHSKINGKSTLFKQEDIQLIPIPIDGVIMHIATFDMSKFTIEDEYLEVEFKMSEYGYDHWIMAAIQILQATDRLHFKIRCEDGIKINTTDAFGQGVDFNISKSDDKKEASISTFQWLTEGAGAIVIASIPPASM
jgi:hypothetical protein